MKLTPEERREVAWTFFWDTYPSRRTEDGVWAWDHYTFEVLKAYLERSTDFAGDEDDIFAIHSCLSLEPQPTSVLFQAKYPHMEANVAHAGYKQRRKVSPVLNDATGKIARYNQRMLHESIINARVFDERTRTRDPFGREFQQYIVAGLAASDVQRMLGPNKYALEHGCFASRLDAALGRTRHLLEHLLAVDITTVDLPKYGDCISAAYVDLSSNGPQSLHAKCDTFHVGATWILHFLNPDLFVVVDRNATSAFSHHAAIWYTDWDEPGYSAAKYIESMRRAQMDITNFGVDRLRALEPGSPLMYVYYKLTFVTGAEEWHGKWDRTPLEYESRQPTRWHEFEEIVDIMGREEFKTLYPDGFTAEEMGFIARIGNEEIQEKGLEWFKDNACYLMRQIPEYLNPP